VESLHLTLVAGAAGLDRPIRWAHPIELRDPRPYLRGHELVLTMGSVLLDRQACQDFVTAVLEREASGIGFGCGNYHPAAPLALREACDAAGLPLLEVPFEVPFISITEWLAARLAERWAHRHRRALRREIHLLDILAEGRGVQGLVQAIGRELDGTVVVTDPEGRPEAVSGPLGATRVGAIVASVLVGAREVDRRISGQEDELVVDLVPVRHQSRLVGWVGWLRPPGGGRGEGIELLYEVAPIVSIELATRAAERARDRQGIGRLMEIVRTGIADPIVLADRLAEAGLSAEGLVASVWPAEAADPLARSLGSAVVGETGGLLLAVTGEAEALMSLATRRGLPCGIGSRVPLAELSRSLAEARAAYEIARRTNRVVTWRDLASLPALLGQQPPERLAAFADQLVVPLVEADARRGSDLLPTLRVFLETEGAVEETARRLHLHPNSLRHRLRRIATLTGRDPGRFLDRVAFYVGLWAWDAQRGQRTGGGGRGWSLT
jgi:purine catabolism regulator